MRKANPKLIGAFVVGAIAILALGLITFGSGEAFREKSPFVAVFDESLGGLAPGAPVTFGGVTIGQVKEIRVEYDIEKLETRIPVFAELEPDRIYRIGTERLGGESDINRLIEKGFRAQLVSLSFVTGQLALDLGFHPDTEVRLSGVDYDVTEVPTIPSGLEQLKQSLTNLPLEETLESMRSFVERLDEIVRSPEFDRSLKALSASMGSLENVMAKAEEDAGPILDNIKVATAEARQTVSEATRTLERFRAAGGNVDREIAATLDKTREVLDDLDREIAPLSNSVKSTAGSVKRTFDSANAMIERGSPMRTDLEAALDNLAAAAKAIRDLAEELRRRPEALIQGKK